MRKIHKMALFNSEDLKQAKVLNISEIELNAQWKRLTDGFPPIQLVAPATPENGIKVLSEDKKQQLVSVFEEAKSDLDLTKFVPASGAATRMFQPIRQLYLTPLSEEALKVIENLMRFPFYSFVEKQMLEKKINPETLSKNPQLLADIILDDRGMGYGHAPKGLIPFDVLDRQPITPFQEHVLEAQSLTDGHVHFTINGTFQKTIESLVGKNPTISYSEQDASTDFIARVGDQPVRTPNGELLFRPSGHGALIKNLNDIEADLIFIKNIDNILPPEKNQTSLVYKKVLGGLMIQYKNKADAFLKEVFENPDRNLKPIINWIKKELNPLFSGTTKEAIIAQLNRPMRIVGMVKNEGKAGGGPFWVKTDEGVSLQIVEGAQIDTQNEVQNKILKGSTHFNPVDMVCAVRDYTGKKYDLLKYIDAETGFDSAKNIDGQEAHIIERPGLWNGAMSGWNTLMIEIPVETFNPVKSVLDLLKR